VFITARWSRGPSRASLRRSARARLLATYKKSTSRMPASAAESLGLAAATVRSLTAGRRQSTRRRKACEKIRYGPRQDDVVTSRLWLFFRHRHTRPSCSKPNGWFQRQAYPPRSELVLLSASHDMARVEDRDVPIEANKVLVRDRRLARRRKALGPVN